MMRSDIQIFSQEYDIPAMLKQADALLYFLEIALKTSGNHDLAIQEVIEEPIIRHSQIWVLTQYHIVHHNYDVDEAKSIKVTTKLIEMNRFFANRYFEIRQGDQQVIEIYAQFAAIDFEKRQIVRLDPSQIKDLDIIDQDHRFKFPKIKMPEMDETAPTSLMEIQADHIDMNDHVNNLVYIKWCLEVTPEDIQAERNLATIDVKFGKEIRKGQAVQIRQAMAEDSQAVQLWYDIYNTSKEEQAAQVTMTWK